MGRPTANTGPLRICLMLGHTEGGAVVPEQPVLTNLSGQIDVPT